MKNENNVADAIGGAVVKHGDDRRHRKVEI